MYCLSKKVSERKQLRVYITQLFIFLFIRVKGALCMSHQYDLVVIGAGPGGYVSAIRASQLG